MKTATERFCGHPLAPTYKLVNDVTGVIEYEQVGGFLSDFYKSIRIAGWKANGYGKDYMLNYRKDE